MICCVVVKAKALDGWVRRCGDLLFALDAKDMHMKEKNLLRGEAETREGIVFKSQPNPTVEGFPRAVRIHAVASKTDGRSDDDALALQLSNLQTFHLH